MLKGSEKITVLWHKIPNAQFLHAMHNEDGFKSFLHFLFACIDLSLRLVLGSFTEFAILDLLFVCSSVV